MQYDFCPVMCQLTDGEQRQKCPYYENEAYPMITQVKVGKTIKKRLPLANEIVFMLKGSVLLSFDIGEQAVVNAGDICSHLLGEGFSISACTDEAEALVFRFYDKVKFCHTAGVAEGENGVPPRFFMLKQNDDIMYYIHTLVLYYDKGLRCRHYLDNKLGELIYLLQVFYSQQDVYHLFHRVVSVDQSFSRKVVELISSCKSVYEIACAMNLSVSGFEKKFKKVFSESPYHWMKRYKAQKVLHLLRSDEMSFKQIASQLEFRSISEFNDFVKREFKQTPGQIRHSLEKTVKKPPRERREMTP